MAEKVYSILAGQDVPVTRAKPTTRNEPAPERKAAKPERQPQTSELMKLMHGTLDYLKLEPTERAKREAQPMIEEERSARQRIETEAKTTTEASQAAHQAETERLRGLLREADGDAQAARTTLTQHQTMLEQTRSEAGQAAKRYEEELAAAKAEASRAPAIQMPTLEPPIEPENIEFEYRKDGNDLLNALLVKAPGYAPLLVQVFRGADNRIRSLKARNP